jgi:hypothetical protein
MVQLTGSGAGMPRDDLADSQVQNNFMLQPSTREPILLSKSQEIDEGSRRKSIEALEAAC